MTLHLGGRTSAPRGQLLAGLSIFFDVMDNQSYRYLL